MQYVLLENVLIVSKLPFCEFMMILHLSVMHFLEPVDVARQHCYVVVLAFYDQTRETLLSWETLLDPEGLVFLVKTWAICHR